ncbi:MAG TPA: FMN-binding protein [Gemmatimonadaceae bacterium]|nr:FMN-binding protein [Gemmatimonadaceae bacterium]
MRLASLPAIALGLLALATPSRAPAQEVLLTRDQAVREIFPEVVTTAVERRGLGEARTQLERRLGRPIAEDSVEVIRVLDAAGRLCGYAVVAEEIGKYRPITFMVGVTPQLTVRDVAVMVYRESRGSDVKRKRFLSQYRGKSARDPIDSNRDIINVSGATISVRAMNGGVRRVLAELTALYAPAPAR